MKEEELKSILHTPCESESFFSHLFLCLSRQESFKREELCLILDLQKEAELSFFYDFSSIQESFRFRNQRRASLIASYLIEENGEISQEKISHLINLLEASGYIIYPEGFSDAASLRHVLVVLRKLKEDVIFFRSLKKFQAPLCHSLAEELVQESLGALFEVAVLSNAQIQRAVLSACLCTLRQNVGSCFATAPAILIQKEQLDYLLNDLYEILMTGKMKRTFGGVEFSVPLSPSSGRGDLYKNVKESSICLSPGLIDAFEASGILSSVKTIQEKIEEVKILLAPFLRQQESLKVSDLIHQVLLSHFHLKEEDLVAHEMATRSFLKSKDFMGGVRRDPLSQKRQSCEEMLLKEKKAIKAFKAGVDHALLKAWEFTLASFSEVKMEFSRWNLYSSLGLNHEEKGGIGEVIYDSLQKELESNNQKVEEYDQEYRIAHDQLRATESLLQSASTESDIRRLKAEFSSRLYHMRSCLELRDEYHAQSSEYSSFFSFLLKEYESKFPEYFQEIYDAEMQDVELDQYEDSPAGFRLVYKHGRSNASLWSMIYDKEQYVDALVDFFLKIEPHISIVSTWKQAAKVNESLTTKIISHIRTGEFLDTALDRMSKAHGEVLPQGRRLEKREKKPWAYTSGGSMSALLKTYYRRENDVTEERKCIESPAELLIFILDTLKVLPLSLAEIYASQEKGMLMSSPSHAFILYPSWGFLKKGWQDDLFTYTWVRDKVIKPGKDFYVSMTFSEREQCFLLEEFSKKIPLEISGLLHKIQPVDRVSVKIFREELVKVFSRFPLIKDTVDSFLYEMTPLVPGVEWKELVRKLLGTLINERLETLLDSFPDTHCEVMSAKKIKELAKAFYLLSQDSYMISFDLHEFISKKAETLGLAPPTTFLFADTNWTNYCFGFVVNPGTHLLELWRLDPTGSQGVPMSSWKQWLDGRSSTIWSLCCWPLEYS